MEKLILILVLAASQQVGACDDAKAPEAFKPAMVASGMAVQAPKDGSVVDLLSRDSESAFTKVNNPDLWCKYLSSHPVPLPKPVVIKKSSYVQGEDFRATLTSQAGCPDQLNLRRIDTGENQDLDLCGCREVLNYQFSPSEYYLLVRTERGLIVYDSLRMKPVLKIWSSQLYDIQFDESEGYLIYITADRIERNFEMMGCSVTLPVELNYEN